MPIALPKCTQTIQKGIQSTATHEIGGPSENQGDSDIAIYGFKIYKISIITIRIIYYQIKVDINP